MAFNGAGVFNRLYSWVQDAINGIKIRADRMDAEDNGFATGLTDCVTRDGQSPWLANLPAGGFKITNLAAGSAAGDSLSYGQAGAFSTVSIGGAALGGNVFALTGAMLASGNIRTSVGDIIADAGATRATGFTVNNTMTWQGNFLAAAGAANYSIVARTNGVVLADGGTSWAAISRRDKKKNFQPIETPYEIIASHTMELGHYKHEDDDAPLRPFLFFEDAQEHWPHAAKVLAEVRAQEDIYKPNGELLYKRGDLVQEEMHVLSPTDYIPLIMAALKEQHTINASLTERLETLERKRNV